MARNILHFVEATGSDAGNVAVLLPGLVTELSAHKIECSVVAASDRVRQEVDGADLVHIHGWGYPQATMAAARARKRGVPYVISPSGGLIQTPDQERSLGEKLRAWFSGDALVRDASAILACNEFEHRLIESNTRFKRLELLPYGFGFGDYVASESPPGAIPELPDGRCLLVLGPIHPTEGLVPLLKAFAEVGPAANGWFVAIVGREIADWRETIEAAVRRKGGEARVMFGVAPDVATQRAWLARAQVLACMSLHVRCPVSILQALAAGVSALVSDRVALPGVDGACTVCPPGRQQIRNELARLLPQTDEQLRESGAQAGQVARNLLDWSVLATRYADLYEDLLR